MAVVRKVGHAALSATGADAFNVGINCGVAAGQVVMHTHVHVMPRRANDGLVHWPKRQVTKDEMDQTAVSMTKLLNA
jgi:diadenosine tetraphosphate (Ap4A) HIT family hydrolase